MSWMQMVYWPVRVLWLAALVLLLLGVLHAVKGRRHWREGRRIAGLWRMFLMAVFAGLGVLAAGAGTALRGYRVLARETPVATILAHRLGPQYWQLRLELPGGGTRTLPLSGDDFRLEAVIVKWKLPVELAGIPPLYRLDRLSGRYQDVGQASQARSTVYDLRAPGPDLISLRRQYPQWLPMVDTMYGSGVYLPLVDGGRYTVSLMSTGALVARPDAATARRLRQRTGQYGGAASVFSISQASPPSS